ncbi:MAG: helix-hairpin-helix domain-containing protein [Polyangiaceae bacterium]|nr:helix-hairpin-helix domain-containing protein [Polyangiaceae bacterium]
MDRNDATRGGSTRKLAALHASLQASAWGAIFGKLILWLGALGALAYVGTRAAASTLGGPPAMPSSSAAAAPVDEPTALAPAGAPPLALGTAAAVVDVAPGASGSATAAPGSASATPSGLTADGRVILNLASEPDLRHLPGVGARRAQAILELRGRLGRFRRLEELLRVRGIGPRMLQRMRPRLVLDPS